MNKWITAGLLLIYFAFTSGLVFKMSTAQGVDNMDSPYSFALSGEDTGIVGVYTEDDIKCAKWLVEQSDQDTQIVSDINGHQLLRSLMYDERRIMWGNRQSFYEGAIRGSYLSDMKHYDKCYIFITTWDTQHQLYIEAGEIGAGLRVSNPLPIFDYQVAYKQGNAVVYLKENK